MGRDCVLRNDVSNWKSLARAREVIQILTMLRLVSLLGLLCMNLAPSLMACPGCKEPANVAGASDLSGINAGFSWSVLFMLCSVASIMGGLIFMMVRSCRHIEARQEVSGQRQLSVTAPPTGSDLGADRGGLASV